LFCSICPQVIFDFVDTQIEVISNVTENVLSFLGRGDEPPFEKSLPKLYWLYRILLFERCTSV
jgi:hypothetical protein